MKFSNTAVAFFAIMKGVVGDFSFRVDYLPVGSVRTDAIVQKDCLSDHVHTFYGPQLLRPEVEYEDLVKSDIQINSGNVVENKSLYWHPAIYEVVDGVYNLVESDDTTAYYLWNSEDRFTAFPNGFRMIGGMRPNVDPTNANAGCAGESSCNKPGNNCNSPNTFFPTTQCEELEVEMAFPNCWDGQNNDSDDHMSHVVYSSDGSEFGSCPGTHPFKLPVIQLFFRINNYKGGHYTFSDGSSVFHADYISGWEETFLQSVLDNCQESTFDTPSQDSCRSHLNYRTPSFASYGNVDDPFSLMLQDLATLQPPKLDTQATIAPEPITGITSLPRGSCTGTLVPLSTPPSTTTQATTTTTQATTTTTEATTQATTTTTTTTQATTGTTEATTQAATTTQENTTTSATTTTTEATTQAATTTRPTTTITQATTTTEATTQATTTAVSDSTCLAICQEDHVFCRSDELEWCQEEARVNEMEDCKVEGLSACEEDLAVCQAACYNASASECEEEYVFCVEDHDNWCTEEHCFEEQEGLVCDEYLEECEGEGHQECLHELDICEGHW